MILRGQIRKDNPMNFEIRNEIAADVQAIGAVTVSAFLNAPHTSHARR
jgi:hypothetical protein